MYKAFSYPSSRYLMNKSSRSFSVYPSWDYSDHPRTNFSLPIKMIGESVDAMDLLDAHVQLNKMISSYLGLGG